MTETASDRLIQFLETWEGVVLKAYVDPAGVVTVGTGFTMASAIFADFAKKKWGRSLKRGDTITRAENDAILKRLVAAEYAPPVRAKLGSGLTQHGFDGATSVCYNAGPGSLGDRWAQDLKSGDVRDAASLLRTTRVTSGGKTLQGLINRRAAEARIIQDGDYGATVVGSELSPSTSKSVAAIRTYQQQLKTLGYYKGAVDGIAGPQTKAAIRNFQEDHPNLNVDGIVGPATRAALERAIAGTKAVAGAGSAGVAVGGAGIGSMAAHGAPEWLWWVGGLGLVAALLGVGIVLYRKRDEIALYLASRKRA